MEIGTFCFFGFARHFGNTRKALSN